MSEEIHWYQVPGQSTKCYQVVTVNMVENQLLCHGQESRSSEPVPVIGQAKCDDLSLKEINT